MKDRVSLVVFPGYHTAFDNANQYIRQRHKPRYLHAGMPMPGLVVVLWIRTQQDAHNNRIDSSLSQSIRLLQNEKGYAILLMDIQSVTVT